MRLTQVLTWLFCLLPLALPTYLIRFGLGSLPTTVLEVYVLVLCLIFTSVHGFKGWMKGLTAFGRAKWLAVAWVLISFGSVFVAPDMWSGLGLWRAFVFEPVLVGLIAAFLFEEDVKHRVNFKESSFTLVCLLAVYAIAQFILGFGIPHPWNVAIDAGRRAVGPFPYPNALALLVVPIGAWAFSVFLTSLLDQHLSHWKDARRDLGVFIRDTFKRRKPWTFFGFTFGAHADWFACLTAIAAMVCALLARSDGGVVALLAAVLLALAWDRRSRPMAITFVALGILLVMIFAPLRQALWHEASFQGWSGRVRVWMWQESADMLSDRPILGAGFGGYPAVFDAYHKKRFIEIFQYPHQIILNVWSETGLAGLAVFVGLLAAWGHAAWKHDKRLLAPLVAIVVHGLVDVPYFKNDLAIWFWVILALVMIQGQKKPLSST